MKIGIADPQVRVRFGLRILLEEQSGWTVIGEATDTQELLTFLRVSCPDLVLIDMDLPDMPIDIILRLLREQYPSLLVMLMSGRQELVQPALNAGADGFASKMESPDKLLNLIQALHARKVESAKV